MDSLAEVMSEVLAYWMVFKMTHNIHEAKVACCRHTTDLFTALDKMQHTVLLAKASERRRSPKAH